jgi:hypothetical protein
MMKVRFQPSPFAERISMPLPLSQYMRLTAMFLL